MTRPRRIVSGSMIVLGIVAVALLMRLGKLHIHWEGSGHGARGESHGGAEAEHHEEGGHVVGGKVVLAEESMKASGIRTAPAAKGSVSATLRVTGEVQLAEDRFAHVTPRIAGAIREVHKTVGDEVEAGTPLCTVESVGLGEARAAFVSALAERTLTERNYERWKQLFEKGLKPQNEFWTAENEFTRAKLAVDAARNRLRALGIEDVELARLEGGSDRTVTNRYSVLSPLAGFILDRHATLGETVEVKDQVFLVADLSQVWVQAAVYERDFPSVGKGMTAFVRIQGFPAVTFTGEVTYVGQQVDEKSRTVPLRVAVTNAPLPGSQEKFVLRPGMFVTVDLETSRKEGVVVVPAAAVQTMDGQRVVFVATALSGFAGDPRKGDGTPADRTGSGPREAKPLVSFEPRSVEVGVQDADVVEIIEGLQPGETVVVDHAFLLKSEFERSKIAEGHSD